MTGFALWAPFSFFHCTLSHYCWPAQKRPTSSPLSRKASTGSGIEALPSVSNLNFLVPLTNDRIIAGYGGSHMTGIIPANITGINTGYNTSIITGNSTTSMLFTTHVSLLAIYLTLILVIKIAGNSTNIKAGFYTSIIAGNNTNINVVYTLVL